MTKKKVKRLWSVKNRTLPPDEKSLAHMTRTLHRKLLTRAEHLKRTPRDRRKGLDGVRYLHGQRSQAWLALYALNPSSALALASELGVRLPRIALTTEPSNGMV